MKLKEKNENGYSFLPIKKNEKNVISDYFILHLLLVK